jgi:hypothetical protein
MTITVINHTDGQVTDEELQKAIRAINRQIKEDFEPYWSISATLRLEGRSTERPNTVEVADMRGDAIIYLWNEADVEDALGYHFQNNRGVPFGFVFTSIALEIGEPWSVTLSHEALELIGDPETNMLVMGPHPSEERDVFHWFEMCDAVQAETYDIDGVAVSNFLLPLYFTGTRDTDESGARNDFLGRSFGGRTLTSFGINPGGYIGFFDPELGEHQTYSLKGDTKAQVRLQVKSKAKEARRSVRYRDFEERQKLEHYPVRAGAFKAAAAHKPKLPKLEYAPIQPNGKGTDELLKATGLKATPAKTASKAARKGAHSKGRARKTGTGSI